MDGYYVEPDYVDDGYITLSGLDGDPYQGEGDAPPQPAGRGRRHQRRNRVRLHGQEWDVTDAELDYILSRLVQEPEVIKPAPRKVKRAKVKTVEVPASFDPEAPPRRINIDNWVLLRNEAERNADAAILAALERLVRSSDEDDIEMLVLM